MFKTLEQEAHCQKTLLTLPQTKHIEREPKGPEIAKKPATVEPRSDPTEYKQAYVQIGDSQQPHAGRPLRHTPIGDW